jgi:DNA polymerase-4
MPMSQALQRCPHAITVDPDWSYYAPASEHFHAILRDYTPLVEPAGADEAYLDVAGSHLLFGDPPAIARDIRRRVQEEIGITASVGVAANKLVAKVASDAGKPDGLVVVLPGEEAAFLAPRPLRDLPMIGAKTADALSRLGMHTLGDIARTPLQALEARFGRHGFELRERALGRSDAPVVGAREQAKSISREMTFGEDEPDRRRLRAVLRGQAERVAADLARQERSARTVTLKLRFPPFETLTRSTTTPVPLCLPDDLFATAAELFERTWAENDLRPVRLLGMGVMNLQERARQLRLGETLEPDHLAATVSELRERFGEAAVQRAAELERTHWRPDIH